MSCVKLSRHRLRKGYLSFPFHIGTSTVTVIIRYQMGRVQSHINQFSVFAFPRIRL